jgi:hypothetical protein
VHTRRLALLALGEIGRCADLSAHASFEPVLFAALSHPSDEVKSAAAFAFGNAAAGAHNVGRLLPALLQLLSNPQTSASSSTSAASSASTSAASSSAAVVAVDSREYLLLVALKELIAAASSSSAAGSPSVAALGPHVDRILPVLFRHADAADEGVRSMAGECLGKLAAALRFVRGVVGWVQRCKDRENQRHGRHPGA